jgi:hypothetical protein
VLELGFCSAILVWVFLADVVRRHAFATDFHYAFWPAARHVLHGSSPYSSVIEFGRLPFVYPAPAAVLLAPFGLLARPVADVVFTLLLAAAAVLTLRLCRVRDWRCYGFAFLWPPVFSAIQTANITLLLALGLAVIWRLRDRTLAAAAVAALLVAVKIFLWPIIIWLAVRRGVRSALFSICLTVLITIAGWSVIGFAGFADYPHLVRLVNGEEAWKSYSLVALWLQLGLSHIAATLLAVSAGLCLLVTAIRLVQTEDDGRRSFALVTAATILFSPVVWLHYFTLLLVPVALLRPKFGPLWLLPILLWPSPVMISSGTWWHLGPLLIFTLVLSGCLRPTTSLLRSPAEPAPRLLGEA